MKNYSKRLKIWEASALIALCICLCTAGWAQGRQDSISSKLVRLHVVAVSDDEYEQSLKLRVRDAVLQYLEPVLKDAEESADAREIISENLRGIAGAAYNAAEGRQVTVSLGRENYPTREYGDFTLPAGEYESLRVVLGEGQGRNWWCVVFPPVCLTAAQTDALQPVMGSEDFNIISGAEGYELRFKLLELWGELSSKLK